ncbi:alpha/beta hydrolase [Microbacterium sp. LMI12-1-1.1]|uniref:alpha/beta fold hydrolase n=1 Tax=Microbacterium sp. LMI12-1-1.1 TaxID=3135225 RepID=UPI00342FC3F6
MNTGNVETAPTLVTSADGTRIAVFASGEARPLVLAPGTSADHTTWRLVARLLAPHFAVHAVDRRGRGASGDGPEYALEREHEDIAAVVDAVASQEGGPVDLVGHSYGGNVAFGATLLTSNVRRLVMYEGWPMPDIADRTTPPEILAQLDNLLASGQPEQMMEAFFRRIVHYTDDEIATVKAAPSWPGRVASAHTVPREIRAFGEQAFDPAQAARIDIPVLLLVGSESPEAIQGKPRQVAAGLPDARIVELEGQGHMANITAPDLTARVLLEFLND